MQTGSMHTFGRACKDSFPEILSLISILGSGKASVRFLAYGDYDTPNEVVEVSGPDAAAEELLNEVVINGGGDFPEASKTAIYSLLREIKAQDAADDDTIHREHVVFLFTGEPPNPIIYHRSADRCSFWTHLLGIGVGFVECLRIATTVSMRQ